MKKLLLLFMLPFILSFTDENKKAPILNGHWTLICYANSLKGTTECKTIKEQEFLVAFDFADDGSVGRFVGHTTSNQVKGRYVLSDSNKITVTDFGGTKIAECNNFGRQFWKAISSSTSYQLVPDTLTVFYDHDTKAMRFLKTIKK